MADKRPIGVFDSGLGGLTVVKEIMSALPNENIIYFGDTGRVPYGTRSQDTIKRYAAEDEDFLIKKGVKLIVAACGTVSSVASDIGKALSVPYFEVVSGAVKEAVRVTKNKKIGVLGTNATVNSKEHQKQILSLLPDAQVCSVGCTLFVPLVEEGWHKKDDIIVKETVARYLTEIKEFGADTVILGCTHYPILSEAISEFLGDGVTLINAGETTAQAVARFINENNIENDCSSCTTANEFYVSDKPDSFYKTAHLLLGDNIGFDDVKQVNIGSL